ncbi:MAG TPA: Fe-S cluster assembly protein SufD [Candidatus Polarisedimenticolia bacterium]|nr:Fe-S cluster assembly protein SufD [Candidatus Polarisedimenticolia bacterium]
MPELANEKDSYLSDFEKSEKELSGAGPSWLGLLRRAAIERFGEMGFPTHRDEDWKQTSVAPIAKTRFQRADACRPDGLTAKRLEEVTFGELECTHLVFVNGHYAPSLSRLRPLPAGVKVGSLASFLKTDPALLEPHLARHVSFENHPFTALNTAFLRDGAFIYLPKGTALDEPVHVLFVSRSSGEPLASHPRNLIVAGEGSQATVVENYISVGSSTYFTNAVTEIVAGENVTLDHCKLQRENEEAFHVSTLQVHLERSSNFTSHAVSLGGALARNDLNAVLDAEGIECTLNGLYLATGRQHVDHHTVIDHAKPHCNSREFYKGVLSGKSHGVFNGKIRVRKDAQKTDAKQTNKNLLLSEEALVDTKPQLEIYADDVKCTHGATIGQLDEEALFYLCSRGIGRETARNVLVHAFASDLIERIPIEPIRTGLECFLMTRLPVGPAAKEKT